MIKSVQDLQVVANLRLNDDQHILHLQASKQLEYIHPGQFANILVGQSKNVFLRRPFSVYSVDYQNNIISFLIKAIGEGTRSLLNARVGSYLDVLFPLGNGFTLPKPDEKVLLVGGGSGVAPLFHLAHALRKNSNNIHILIGARTVTDLVEMDNYKRYANLHTTTEDGSYGEKGFVTDHSLFKEGLEKFSRVYTCGPDPMMKAVAGKAAAKSVFCEVSLENSMACGFGVCLCCVVQTIQGHKCVCTEGPVFNISQLKWQI